MNTKEKQEYLEKYKAEKEKGLPFFPDILFKDAVISLLIFLVLIALAYFRGAPLEAPANPADSNYTPKPEWYFLFLFQLLKYFPPQLEVVGVVLLPTLVVILLFLLPFLDKSPKRYFASRLPVIAFTSLAVVGVLVLSVLSVLEAPPPVEAAQGDQTAALYLENCSGCHGASINVAADTNLHAVIAQGKHEGMPPWSADLTSDQIDALAGFILSPGGSKIFTENCGSCHEASELVASDPLEIKKALEQGKDYSPHAGADIPIWSEVLDKSQRTALINFLIAPDGQRLFVTNCAACHGKTVAFSGTEEELRSIIRQGGLHLAMPPWQEKLTPQEIEVLAKYVHDPQGVPEGAALFSKNCSKCHGQRIPAVQSVEQAQKAIATGGAHQTMPVWGDILTEEQIDALVSFTQSQSEGSSIEAGQKLFDDNCTPCHGDFGEGGPNPARPGDVIAPISTSEYLKTRDDFTLRSIIAQGQPNFGMSPFGSAFGGPLETDEIDNIVAYIRSWEANPPVEQPPNVTPEQAGLSGEQIYVQICANCHGLKGEGGLAPSLSDPAFQGAKSDEEIFTIISQGHPTSGMIGWSELFSSDQIQQVVQYIRTLKSEPSTTSTAKLTPAPTPTSGPVSFANDVLPLLKQKCTMCHGTLGGWSATTYEEVMNSGENAPVVIPGDPEGSLLGQKLLGTQSEGGIMPPGGKLPDDELQLFLNWIRQGALDN